MSASCHIGFIHTYTRIFFLACCCLISYAARAQDCARSIRCSSSSSEAKIGLMY